MSPRLAWSMFVVSGGAGLIFEVALQRSLTRVFGVSAFATSTVLAAWMAGLALGALAFGRLADRVKSPLRLYAWLELGIAATAFVAPHVVPELPAFFASFARDLDPGDGRLLAGRLALAFAVTLVPTVLMGGTLPAVARGLSGVQGVARLYTANLLGAATGAGLCSYALLPSLGLAHTQYFGGVLNLVAAGIALVLARTPAASTPSETTEATVAPMPVLLLLMLAAWSGFVTFGAEVTWFHLLAVVVGNSVYAFGAMLATFLLGLTLGSSWLAQRKTVTLELAGRVQLAAAALLAISLLLWDRVPNLFLAAGPYVESFAAREIVRALACAYMLLVPSTVLGVIFPMVLRLAPQSAKDIGRLSAINTVAAVVASLATGFLLLPALGSRGTLILLTLGTCAATLLLLRGRWRLAPLAVVLVTFVLPDWNAGRLASGYNVYFERQYYSGSEAIWSHESVESGLTSVMRTGPGLTLLTNGKFQGNTGDEVIAQRAFAQIPLLVQHHWGSALVIGLGTGCSLGELTMQPWEKLEVMELSRDIITAADVYFGEVNGHALHDPRVKITHADARNALLLSTAKYDLVSMEISSIWFAGAADLYGREFNALVAGHLTPTGVFQQWVQLHHMSRHDFAVILASLRAEFKNVAVFSDGGQGIVVASNAPMWLDYPALVAMIGTRTAEHIQSGDPLLLLGNMVIDTAGVDALIADERGATPMERFISTDDSLALEFSTPRSNANDDLTADALLASIDQGPSHALELRGAGPNGVNHARAAVLLKTGETEEGFRAAEAAGPIADRLVEWARRRTR